MGRWGGEKFLCVLPDLDLDQVTRLAESLRQTIEAQPIHLPDGRSLHITLSIGVAAGRATDADHILLAADAAVYDAKRTGRNRVVAAAGRQILHAAVTPA